MKQRKIIFAIVTALLMLFCCIACNDDNKKKPIVHDDPNALIVLGKKSDMEKEYMQRIFRAYENTGKTLKIVEYEDKDFEEYAVRDFENGNIPDIFFHFHNADLNKFDIESNFYYLNDESWVSDLTDSAKAYCTDQNGKLLGLPFWESSVSGCYYNKTLLDEMGLEPAHSQIGFNNLCENIMEFSNEQNQLAPICWPANGCSWMLQFGLDPIFADDPETLDALNRNELTYSEIPEVKDMVQWIHDAAKKGWFGNNFLNTGWNEISKDLSTGKAVMAFIWDTWFYTDFKPGKYTIDDFALMPVFLGTEDNGTYEGGNLNMMMVPKNSEKRDAALDFLAFCATPSNYNMAFDGISTVNCFKGMTTNIQSQMVTDAKTSIADKERVSTASTKIIAYSADEMCKVLNEMFKGALSVEECIKQMDKDRIASAKKMGIENY